MAEWHASVGQIWQWSQAGLLGEDIAWLEKVLAPAHEGHPEPDPCWIRYEYLGHRRRRNTSW